MPMVKTEQIRHYLGLNELGTHVEAMHMHHRLLRFSSIQFQERYFLQKVIL